MLSRWRSGIRIVTVEFEVSRHHAAETSQPVQPFLPVSFPRSIECRSGVGDLDIDVVTFLQTEGIDNCRRDPNGQAVAPSENLHGDAPINLLNISNVLFKLTYIFPQMPLSSGMLPFRYNGRQFSGNAR
jgi:hypothetical protein